MEFLERLPKRPLIAHDSRLRQLKAQVLMGDPVPLHYLLRDGERIHLKEIQRRQIDRYGDDWQAVLFLIMEQLHDAADHEGIELMDESGLLQHGDDGGWRDQAMLRVIPAHQCLDMAELSRQDAHAGLQVNLDLPLLQRLCEMREDVRVKDDPVAHRFAIDGPAALHHFLRRIIGHLRLIER